jgi:anthranilate phosphoribosyltransferase
MTVTFEKALDHLRTPGGMDAEQTTELLSLLVTGTLPVEQGAQLLTSWAERGETGRELGAAVRFLRARAVAVPVLQDCLDLCGTGGSGLSRYNISTTVAFVVAAAHIPVAKHGNRGSKMPNGSFDLLDELGICFELSPQAEARLQKETGLCFLFARTHHPAVGKVVTYRKEAGCRSIFNLAGPLANPAKVSHQLIGTTEEKTARVLADGLLDLGTNGALVVWGHPGIDEISITGETGYLQISAEGIVEGSLVPERSTRLKYEDLPGGDAKTNAQLFYKLLSGAEKGPLLDMLVENCGVTIDLYRGRPPLLGGPGATEARDLIRSGVALAKFEQHRDLSHHLQGT